MEKKTYAIKVECSNCKDYKGIISIEKGVRVYKELQSRECPICGCCELVRVEKDLTWTTTNSTDDVVTYGRCPQDNIPSAYKQETYLCGK